MFSVCGVSMTLPNISLEENWIMRVSGFILRMASRTRVTPRPVTSAVSMGWFQLAGTKLCAPALIKMSGFAVLTASFMLDWSVRSPGTMVILSSMGFRWIMFGVLILRTMQ